MLLCLGLMGPALAIHAQTLTTVTGIRIYEHHSSSINNNAPFGSSANGSKSAYDFVNRKYVYSFDSATMSAYTGGQEANIDLVEHNGPFGNNGDFGFTSGVSSIWGGDIKGNGTTYWMMAPPSFNYSTATNASHIFASYNAGGASKNIFSVEANKVYLGRIRGSDLYVAVKVTNVKNATGMNGTQDVYFEFEYKYAKYVPATGIEEAGAAAALTISPNPARDHVVLSNTGQEPVSAKVTNICGQTLRAAVLEKMQEQTVDLSGMSKGIYFVTWTLKNGASYTRKLVRE